MSIVKGLSFAAVCTFLITYGGAALADDQAAPGGGPPPAGEGGEHLRLPVSVTERGITNPALILSPVLDLGIVRAQLPNGLGGNISATGLVMDLGAGFSITDDFGVRATPLALAIPISPSGSPQYGGASFGATYRFVKGDFELGGAADVMINTPSGASAGVSVSPSIPMRAHLGKVAALDIVPQVNITAGEGLKSAVAGMGIPVRFLYDVVEPVFHVGAQTGFLINDFSDAGHTIGIPLGFLAGYAVPGPNGPIVDIDAAFTWPELFVPGAPAGVNAVEAGLFVVGLEATGYLYL